MTRAALLSRLIAERQQRAGCFPAETERGLIEREDEPGDRRRRFVAFTQAGREAAASARIAKIPLPLSRHIAAVYRTEAA